MKILHIIYDDTENPWVGGGGAVRAREINRILAKKHSVTTVTGNYPDARNGKIHNITFNRIGFSRHYFLSRLTFTLLVPFYLRRYDYEIVINEFSAFSPVFCELFTRKPVVNTFYHRIGLQVLKKFWILGIFAYVFERLFLMMARNIITISPSVTREIVRENDSRRIECIYTGIDSALLSVEPAPGEYIAYIGRLDIYMKGLDILLEAFHGLSESLVQLKIAGTGPQKNIRQLEQIIKKYGLRERVSLLGRISDDEKKEFLRHALFVVMPSRFEGWGIAAVEAAACGKAVIGTDIPGLQDAVVSGKTGLLVESNSVQALSEAMMRLLQDEVLRSELEENGKQWAQNFQWDTIADKQERFYQSVLVESSRRS